MHVFTNPDLSFQPGILGILQKRLCHGGKPDTGKLNTDVCLCGSTRCGCMVDGLGATTVY